MDIGNIIYSLITLIFIAFFIFSPLIKKMLASNEKKTGKPSEDDMYESVDSHRVIQRTLNEENEVPHIEIHEPSPLMTSAAPVSVYKENSRKRISQLPPLKQAVIWKEILDKPVGWD